jgi:hypothetical protein
MTEQNLVLEKSIQNDLGREMVSFQNKTMQEDI